MNNLLPSEVFLELGNAQLSLPRFLRSATDTGGVILLMIYTTLTEKTTQPFIYQICSIISNNKQLRCFIIKFAKFPSAQKLTCQYRYCAEDAFVTRLLVRAHGMAGLPPSLSAL